jgi:hypothetical protein
MVTPFHNIKMPHLETIYIDLSQSAALRVSPLSSKMLKPPPWSSPLTLKTDHGTEPLRRRASLKKVMDKFRNDSK